jgi:hypothetical protein
MELLFAVVCIVAGVLCVAAFVLAELGWFEPGEELRAYLVLAAAGTVLSLYGVATGGLWWLAGVVVFGVLAISAATMRDAQRNYRGGIPA